MKPSSKEFLNKVQREVGNKNITTSSAVTPQESTTNVTIWRGGWVTDNFRTYYLDENMVEHKTEPLKKQDL